MGVRAALGTLAARLSGGRAAEGPGEAPPVDETSGLDAWQRTHQRRTGYRIDVTRHPDDEMYEFIRDLDPGRPIVHYLVSGESMVSSLGDVLALAGRTIERDQPFLEFACGHGRFTRHLVNHVDRSQITVSDIHEGAVAFVRSQFDVDGFPSVTDPATLDHDGRYQVIYVASLFSHLPMRRWLPWLDRLLALLAPGGVVVFSTHGPTALADREDRSGLIEVEPGFWFGPDNESLGRLESAEYGTTYVDEAFVRRAAESLGGQVLAQQVQGLWGFQDLYVVGRG